MKITKEQLKNIVRETLQEESEYQTFFKKALEKAGKSIPSMSDEEKKAFFNKIEKTWKGRGQKSEGNAFGAAVAKAKKDGDDSFEVDGKEYKTERFGRGHEGPTFGSEEESVNEKVIKAKDAGNYVKMAKPGRTLKIGNDTYTALGKGKWKGPNGEKLNWIEVSSIASALGNKKVTYESKVNEGVEPQIKKIAYFTGTRPEAVEDFVSKHSLNITKLLKYVEKGKLPQRMELVSALAGRPNNPVQKKIIKMFKESVINEGPSTEEKRIAMLAVRKQAKYRNVSLEQAIQDQINALEDLKRDVKKGKLK